MRKIYKSALRDLWFHKSRSIVLVLAFIVITAFPIAFINLPYNLDNIIQEEQEEYNLAHFNLFFNSPVDANTTDILKEMIKEKGENPGDFIIESRMQISSKIPSSGKGKINEQSWINTDIIALDSDNLPQINQIVLVEGSLPQNENETIILESMAISDGLELGDIITIYSYRGAFSYTITGYIQSIEYSSYDLSQIALIMLDDSGMKRLLEYPINFKLPRTSFPIYFKYDISIEKLRDLADHLRYELELDKNLPKVALIWFVREASFRKGLHDALELTSEYMYAASLFIFLVAGVIIFVVMNRYVNEQKTTLGAIYSYGVKRRSIFYSFILRVFILSIFGILLGMLFARYLLDILVKDMADSWGLISSSTDFSASSIVFTLFSSAVVTYSFTIVAVANLLKLTPYEAMRGKTSELKSRGIIFTLVPYIPIKIIRNSVKNLTRNRTRSFLTVIAFTLALSFAWSLSYTNASIGYTINEFYENQVFFDIEVEIGFENSLNFPLLNELYNLEGVRVVEPYVNQLIQFVDHQEHLSFLKSFNRDTEMFKIDEQTISEGRWFRENTSEVVLSRYVAGTYNYEIGDALKFSIENIQFNSTVVGIANELVSSSSVMIDLRYISGFLNPFAKGNPFHEYDVFNKLLVKVDSGVDVYSLQELINKEYPEVVGAFTSEFYQLRFTSLANSQSAIIDMMSTLGLVVGAVSIFTTLLIAIVERERELALLQVFGYSKISLFLQILVEGLLIGFLSLVPAFILARLLTLYLWMAIVNSALFELLPFFSEEINIRILIFALITIISVVFISTRIATNKRIVEVLREE